MPLPSAVTSWFSPRAKSAAGPWQGAAEGPQGLRVAQVLRSASSRPRLVAAGALNLTEPGHGHALALATWPAVQRRAPVVALMRHADYQLLQMEAPAVPRPEWRSATRWLLREQIDYDPEQAQLDCVAIPNEDGSDAKRMFVLVAPRDAVRDEMLAYRAQRLNLAALDVPEMALRNLLALPDDGPARGMLAIAAQCCWLVLTWRNELVATRRLDIGTDRLADPQDIEAQGLQERVALEFQRTCDAFSRQYTQSDLRRVWLLAGPHTEFLSQALQPLLATELAAWRLADHFEHDGPATDDVALALAAGAAMREMH